eukprot:XP_001689567.1 predicted protein [Chlamydomonas reinhardtii]
MGIALWSLLRLRMPALKGSPSRLTHVPQCSPSQCTPARRAAHRRRRAAAAAWTSRY